MSEDDLKRLFEASAVETRQHFDAKTSEIWRYLGAIRTLEETVGNLEARVERLETTSNQLRR